MHRIRDDERRRRLEGVLDETSDLVALAHPDGELFYLNRAAADRLGVDVTSGPVWVREVVTADGLARWEQDGLAALQESGRWSADLQLRGADGTTVTAAVLVMTHLGPDGLPQYLSMTGRDISDRVALLGRLLHQARHDEPTGLPNRNLLVDRLRAALAAPGPGTTAVLWLDLDRFKAVNDSLGRDTGNELLRGVGERLKAVLRPDDVLARVGGDEYGVLLGGLGSADEAVQVAERLLGAMDRPFPAADQRVYVGVSIGVAVGEPDADTMLRHAELALYRAKERGRGRWELFQPELHERARRRLRDEAALGAAITHENFLLHFQPVVRLSTGEVSGVEALVRWLDPERGMVPPDEFIPLAEETGLITRLGRWVLREACRRALAWQHELGEPHFEVAVNVSPRQLREPDFVDQVLVTLEETGLPPHSLLLEVTETAVLDDPETVVSTMRRLGREQVRFALDDFGQGYSSLGHLKRLPIDVVKIDKEFVAGLASSRSDAQIVSAVVTMAKALNLEVTAEGIETAEQLALLRELGCDFGQGFLLSRPLDRTSLSDLLSSGTVLVG